MAEKKTAKLPFKTAQANIFPDKRLIESAPVDTQVMFVGEFHEDLFHRVYNYLNLPDFAAKGFSFTAEANALAQIGAKKLIRHLGFRPDQMQRYDHVDLSKKDAVLPAISPSWKNFNIFKNANLCPASSFKTFKAAQALGMNLHFIDNPRALNHEKYDSAFMKARNVYMAGKIIKRVEAGEKVYVWCGHDHLYAAPEKGTADASLQQLVSAAGIKTFATGLLCSTEALLEGDDDTEDFCSADLISSIDENAALILAEFYERYHLRKTKKAFTLNLHDISENAGRELPDQLVVFPNFSFDYVSHHYQGSFYYKNSVIEADLWNDLWTNFSKPARNAYKNARREEKPQP